ncbi:MAG TPA: HAMP domain-containing sensor histidine kinase, partial [Pirellulales bacterium]|nr:HAMP domain-containing sensor histidine kinase [Pirellulales bacterium]
MKKDVTRASHLEKSSLVGKKRRQTEPRASARRLLEGFSHDFRTPLTVIREFAAIMREELGGPTTDKQQEYLATIIARTDDLSLAIDDLLDASALQAGTLALWRRAVPPSEIIDHVRAAVDSRLQARGVALETAVDDALPAAYCDVSKVVRVIVNLASRSLKQSPAGSRLCISATTRDGGRELVFKIAADSAGQPAVKSAASDKPSRRFGDAAMQSTADDFDLGTQLARELMRVNLGSVLSERHEGGPNVVSIVLPAAEPLSLFERYLEFVQATANESLTRAAPISLMLAEIDEGVEPKLLSA